MAPFGESRDRAAVAFKRHVVVVDVMTCVPAEARAHDRGNNAASPPPPSISGWRLRSAARTIRRAGYAGTHLVAGVERTAGLGRRAARAPDSSPESRRRWHANRCAPSARAARLRRLELDEVIAAAEGRELEHAFLASVCLEAGLTERHRGDVGRLGESDRRFRLRAGTARPIAVRTRPAMTGLSRAAASASRATASMPQPMSPPTACDRSGETWQQRRRYTRRPRGARRA